MSKQYLSKLVDVIGNQNIGKVSICGVKPFQMNEIELEILIQITEAIKRRRVKSQLFVDQFLVKQVIELVGENFIDSIDICGIKPKRMDKEELEILVQLLRVMKLRSKGYKVVKDRWKMVGETVLVKFQYHPKVVEMVQRIPTAQWKKDSESWHIHISQWPAIEEVFRITQYDLELAYQKWFDYNQVNRLRVTNKGCYLTGISLPVEEIHMATSFPDPNAKHMQSYQNGSWDGRVALFDKGTGFVPIGLLGRVLNILKQRNVQFQFINERVQPEKRYAFRKNVKLRDYQELTLSKAMQQGKGILQLATGAGKTKTASAIVSDYGLNTIFFVHTKFLLGQAKSALEEVLEEEIGQVGDGIVNIRPVTVAMVQTTIKALGQEYNPSDDDDETDPSQLEDNTDIRGKEASIIQMLESSEVVFFDECQFVAAESFYTIANYCNAYYKFGLSATPYRSDKKDLMIEAALGPVIHRINASYLIKRGFLTKPKIFYLKVGSEGFNDDRKYQTVYREEIAENFYRNQLIVKSTKKLNKNNQSVLILVQQVVHGKVLQEMFKQEGMDVDFVSGEDDLQRRESAVYKLRTKKALALIATTIADEGLDVPSLDAVVLGGGGKSPSKGMQRVGRAIRVFGQPQEAFEIFSSAEEVMKQGKNILLVVDNHEHALFLKEYFEKEEKNKKSISLPYIWGEAFQQQKESLFSQLKQRNIPILMVAAKDISSEEVNQLKPLDCLFVSGGMDFNYKEVLPMPKPVSIFTKEEDVEAILLEIKEHGKTLLLVDETKQANLIKEQCKVQNIPVKYLTGEKNTDDLKNKIFDLFKKNDVVMINAKYINEAIDYHSIPHIILSGNNKEPFLSIEQIKKDIRVFTPKKEAIIIDFIDNCKFLYKHSVERKQMFSTEEEFEITGW